MEEIFKSQTKAYSVGINMGNWDREDDYETYDGYTINSYIGFANAFRAMEKEIKEFDMKEEYQSYDIFFDIVDAEFGDLIYRRVIHRCNGSKLEDFDADSLENKVEFVKKHSKFYNMEEICKYTSFVTYEDYKCWVKGSFGSSNPDSFLSDIIYTMLRRSRSN